MKKTKEGFALIVVIVGVLVLSTMTMTALDMGSQEARSAQATRVSASALYVADSGVTIERAAAAWPDLAPGQTSVGPWKPLANGGQYRPTIQRRDDGLDIMQIYSVTVEGRSPGALGGQATVQIWATRFALTARFTRAIGANGHLTVNGTPTVIDSYDSSLGPYCNSTMLASDPPQCTTLNVGSDGDVHANGTISLAGDAHIMGDAATATTTINDPKDNIEGVATTEAPPQLYPVETCPDYTESMPGSAYTKPDFTWSGGTYTINGGTYSFHNFKMTGNSTVLIPAGQTVTIYLSGELSIGGQSLIQNENLTATSLSFVACNRGAIANTTSWKLHGGSEAYFTVYAPNNNVDLVGGSPVFGAVVANNFKVTGGGSVHYDITLGVLEEDSPQQFSSIMPRSWRQLLR